MTMPVLSGRPVVPISDRERARRSAVLNQAPPIPPELLLRRDDFIRYERNGPVYATDGKVGVLKKVVVDEGAGEVVEIGVQMDGSASIVMLPPDVVDKSAGSALFLTINHAQVHERAASGATFVKGHFAKLDLKSLGKRSEGGTLARRSVSRVTADFVETPTSSPLDRLHRRPETIAAD